MLIAPNELRIRADIEVANQSDVGCERTENEDYFLFIEPRDDQEFVRRGRLILIADGMGGRNGGEVASRLAADVIREAFVHGDNPEDPRSLLISAFQAAHQAILEVGHENAELEGLGTTCCAAILKQGQLHYAHVGDSRIYLMRDGVVQRLTEDHNVAARLVREGAISPEEAKAHPQRNVLTAALGIDSDSAAGDFPADPLLLAPGDILLLCTDGLHSLMSDREMALALQGQSLTEACKELVGRAKVLGGPDNITLQLLKIKSVDK